VITQRPGRPDSSACEDHCNAQKNSSGQKLVSLATAEPYPGKSQVGLSAPELATSELRWNPPYMRWFENDFQASPRVRRLHPLARLILRALLCAAWHTDSAPCLPNDSEQLRVICDCPARYWKRHGQAVMGCFSSTRDGKWLYHPKMVREYEHALSEHSRKVAAGKSRWNKAVTEIHKHEHLEFHHHKHVERSERTSKTTGRNLSDDGIDDE
jgi:uncharacterized protein YdaU (DUF1376 family)